MELRDFDYGNFLNTNKFESPEEKNAILENENYQKESRKFELTSYYKRCWQSN